tara:strand:+ start:335 stop:1009 length:675 start_codon:yes stop_codon:yes gene_type:complete
MTYSGSPNSYFRQLPDLDYPSLKNDRTSAFDFEVVKNLFKRAVMREDIINDIVNFTKYSVQDDERPDQVAYDFYRDAGLDWVILTTNNIIHVRDEWPMGNQDFLTYLNGKYTDQELSNIHHYETRLITDSRERTIQKAGLFVPSDHSITYVDNGVVKTQSQVKQVTFLEHETKLNDDKRQINILRPQLLDMLLSDISDIMTYQRSNQYVTDDLKKTENPRIISP